MKNSVKLLSVIIGVSLFLTVKASAQEFSADVFSTIEGAAYEGKIFVTKDKVRMEIPGNITITRMDKQVVWMLMPNERMYMEQPFNPRNVAAATEDIPGEIERTFIGEEPVDGRMASKYRVVYETDGKSEAIFQWIDESHGIPVKTAAEDGNWTTEYKNLKIDTQPDSLFEIPEGYNKFSYEMPQMEVMP